ncbi:MAG: hypothetical protein JWM74_5281 [Myxococcaceae bacterium]|nr:hypothetical protein [Myxococcaceae bacterium]
MSFALGALTWMCFAVPVSLLYLAAVTTEEPARAAVVTTFAFVSLVYASVYFVFRPTRFEVDDTGLRILWPIRARRVARTNIAEARRLSSAAFRKEYGYGLRIGAGGLWGGFGLLRTKRATFSMWVSRTDDFVIVRLNDGRPLLLTPEEPAAFVEAVQRLVS